MPLQPGDALANGQYRVVRLLGRGGFGFVYLARDMLLQGDVAVKELIPALAGDEDMLKRFLVEAKATILLRHKRIVATHNAFAERGNYYIAMEYMPGGSLEERLGEGKALPVEEAVRVAADVCEALECAHEDGVVHCDLKPANILFGVDGRAKVADFGIAHVPAAMFSRTWATTGGMVAGTLPYMSPEQAEGVRDEPRTDVYALGAVLYRMLTGRTYLDFDPRETPRAQADNMRLIDEVLPVPPGRHNARVPAWLDAIVLKALAKQREDRYVGAGALREALRQGEAGLRVPRAPGAASVAAPDAGGGADVGAQSQPAREPTSGAPKAIPSCAGAGGSPTSPRIEPRRFPEWAGFAAAGGGLFLVVVVIAAMTQGSGASGVATAVAARQSPAPARLSRGATEVTKLTWTPAAGAAAVPTSAPARAAGMTALAVLPTAASVVTTAPTLAPDAAVAPALASFEMVLVPAGTFQMGCDTAHNGGGYSCSPDVLPLHAVYLDAYRIDRTEATNARYRQCVVAGGCTAPSSNKSSTRASYYNNATYAEFPVINVSWEQAQAYCRWAGKRQPSEAEWEKAARGALDTRAYPWGDGGPTCAMANCFLGGSDCVGDTSLVGSYPGGASPYGALDMSGNVSEWVSDWFNGTYYWRSPSSNPPGQESGTFRVQRGGSWGFNDVYLRAATRSVHDPSSGSHYIGFRCVAAPGT